MNKLAYANDDIVKHYVKTRPSPPAHLAKTVIDYLIERKNGKSNIGKVCLDVGCGSGQNTQLYSQYFQSVIGIDASPNQVAAAQSNNTQPNVVYKVSSAELLPFKDASVDLITCCESVHWFNIEQFFTEARRIICPGGVIACYGYWDSIISYNGMDLSYITTELQDSWNEFWIQGYSLLKEEYTNLPNLYTEQVFIKSQDGKFCVEKEETVDEYMDLILSYPMYQSARNRYGQQIIDKEIECAKQRMYEAMGVTEKQEKLKVQYKYFLKMWRKPTNITEQQII